MKGLAGLGRFEDDTLAHVATGEMIVPPQSITPRTRSMIESDMMNMGMNPNQYVVGGENSINPNTGMPEFFLKKLVKKLGKAVKKNSTHCCKLYTGGRSSSKSRFNGSSR